MSNQRHPLPQCTSTWHLKSGQQWNGSEYDNELSERWCLVAKLKLWRLT